MRPERAIGVDVGGTKILAGHVSRDGTIGRTRAVPSPNGSEEELLAALDEVVEGLLEDGVAAVGYGVPSNLDRRTVGCDACRDGLEMAPPVAVPRARRPARLHDDVAELGPAPVEPVIEYEPAADASAEREHDEVGRAAPRAEPPLRQCRRVRVVLDADRQPEALAACLLYTSPSPRDS